MNVGRFGRGFHERLSDYPTLRPRSAGPPSYPFILVLDRPRLRVRSKIALFAWPMPCRIPLCGAVRGLSSAGRAPDLHSGGQRFDPARLHHLNSALAGIEGRYR